MSTTSYEFKASFEREERGHITLEAGPRVPIAGGPPPEFGGTAIRWSPEHLLIGAAGLCFTTTLEWHAARRAITILELHCEARGTVEKTPRGLAFTAVELDVKATAAIGQAGALRELVERAETTCLVSASLTCPVRVHAEIEEGHLG